MAKKKAKKKVKKKIKKKPGVKESPVKLTPYPEAGKKIDDFEKDMNNLRDESIRAEQAGDQPGSKPGDRPAGDPGQGDHEAQFSYASCLMLARAPFELAAQKTKFDFWRLTDSEAKLIADPFFELSKYMPKMPVWVSSVMALSVATYMVFTTKNNAWLIEQERRQELEPRPGQPGQPTEPGDSEVNYPTNKDIKVQNL